MGAADDTPRRSRVVVHDMPQMLHELVLEVLRDADVEIVAMDVDEDELVETVARTRADVVISHLESDRSSTAASGLFDERRLRVLALSATGRTGEIFELLPRRAALGELSAETLLAAIREATA